MRRRATPETTWLRALLSRAHDALLPDDIIAHIASLVAEAYRPPPLRFVNGVVNGRRRAVPPADYFSGGPVVVDLT